MCLQIQAHVLSIDGKRPINFAYSLISKNTQDKWDLPWVSDKGNSLKICLLKNFNNYLVLLPDVTREQIKFTLFWDIQLTYFNLYFFLGLKYTNLFYLEWGANLNYYQKEKKN